MGIAEELETAKRLPGYPCGVLAVLEALPGSERDELELAFNDQAIRGEAISRVLKRRGYSVSGFTVQRHRRGDCSCARR